jgi:LacI family transcriptional regulator
VDKDHLFDKVGAMSSDDSTSAGTRTKRVTQRDVARLVGVSSAAVSYAFNGSNGVSEENRQRIFEAAKALGFRPNLAAKGLRLGRTNMVGLLLADIANPFYPELASGIVNAAAQRGSQVFLSQVGVGGAMQADAARGLADRNCDGLIFTSVVAGDAPLLRELQQHGIPFVYVNRRIGEVLADWVGIDDYAGSAEAAALLVEDGRRRIAVIGGPDTSSVSSNRVRGALAALEDAGIEVLDAGLLSGDLTRESGAARMHRLLAEAPEVDGIVCGNDMIALGVLDVCHRRGIEVPGQIALVGFDDMSFASAGPLQLSTVSVPRQQMGERAIEMLFDRIGGYAGPIREEVLPHKLQIRATARGARRET